MRKRWIAYIVFAVLVLIFGLSYLIPDLGPDFTDTSNKYKYDVYVHSGGVVFKHYQAKKVFPAVNGRVTIELMDGRKAFMYGNVIVERSDASK